MAYPLKKIDTHSEKTYHSYAPFHCSFTYRGYVNFAPAYEQDPQSSPLSIPTRKSCKTPTAISIRPTRHV